MKTLLTVDPGDNTGWAYWQNGKLLDCGQITGKEKNVYKQFEYMWYYFNRELKLMYPSSCIMEGVEVFSGSIISHIAARKRKGQEVASLFKLAYLIGGYIRICQTRDIPIKIIAYREWAGQLTNKAVAAQIKHITGKEFKTQHIYDAVGIGLNYYGKM